jgi:hypothetical protein
MIGHREAGSCSAHPRITREGWAVGECSGEVVIKAASRVECRSECGAHFTSLLLPRPCSCSMKTSTDGRRNIVYSISSTLLIWIMSSESNRIESNHQRSFPPEKLSTKQKCSPSVSATICASRSTASKSLGILLSSVLPRNPRTL